MFCLNLCDILLCDKLLDIGLKDFIENIFKNNKQTAERIYIGSNFCSQYFLSSKYWNTLFEYLQDKDFHLTLVLPIFSEKDLQKGKDKLDFVLKQLPKIDEITVNDYGMLDYIQNNYNFKVNLGRLFFKDTRDIRVFHLFKNSCTPALLSTDLEKLNINSVELDLTHQTLDLSMYKNVNYIFSIHYPLCYATVGNICKYASINYDIEHKFRPNLPCAQDCFGVYQTFGGNNSAFDYKYYLLGRTVYFENNHFKGVKGRVDRKIYYPLYEFLSINQGEMS